MRNTLSNFKVRYGQSEHRIYAQNIAELEKELNQIFGNNDNLKKQIIQIIIRDIITEINLLRERNSGHGTSNENKSNRESKSSFKITRKYFSTDGELYDDIDSEVIVYNIMHVVFIV